MVKTLRGRFSIAWYILVDKLINGYMKYLTGVTGMSRNAIVRRAITEQKIIPNVLSYAGWKAKQKGTK